MIKKLLLLVFIVPLLSLSALEVGVGKAEITPPVGTPSAGYPERKGEGMEGVHDPLYATTLFIGNGDKKIMLCSVDHLGFTHEMVREIVERVHAAPELEDCAVYVGSSHTHSGGGAYLNIPIIGESLAGSYRPEVTEWYIEQTIEAMLQAYRNHSSGKVGIGYGKVEGLSQYRGLWPKDVAPLADVTVIKVTKLDDTPLAVLFNFPVHPTVLKSDNRLFSSDFVGFTREYLQELLNVEPLFFNGAQGDIIPTIFDEKDRFNSCALLAASLATAVKEIWEVTDTSEELSIATRQKAYTFKPQATPFGLVLPVDNYESELNLIVLNDHHAFLTIPGELSCLYDERLKERGIELGFDHVSIFGLTNDAHGYIILPESWNHKTFESGYSFGGENYGEFVVEQAETLLKLEGTK